MKIGIYTDETRRSATKENAYPTQHLCRGPFQGTRTKLFVINALLRTDVDIVIKYRRILRHFIKIMDMCVGVVLEKKL